MTQHGTTQHNMTHHGIEQVLVMAHGWAYNHRFFDAFLDTLPAEVQEKTLLLALESGYFPDQATAGLMVNFKGEWTHHPAETLHSLVLTHAGLPWLGLGHSLGFSRLLNYSLRWHSLVSVHGFTRFCATEQSTEGTPPRVLARMLKKAEQDMPEVLTHFHARCGHTAHWAKLDEQALLDDLRSMQQLDCAHALHNAIDQGTQLHALAGTEDKIVPLELAQACFNKPLSHQGRTLHLLAAEHASFAGAPARYTDVLLPLLSPR